MDSQGFKNAKKREKTVSRAYGGSRCHACVRQRFVRIEHITIQEELFKICQPWRLVDLVTHHHIFYRFIQSCSSFLDWGTENREEGSCWEVKEAQKVRRITFIIVKYHITQNSAQWELFHFSIVIMVWCSDRLRQGLFIAVIIIEKRAIYLTR